MISIAPMVDVTDRHFRYMCRLLTKRALLYTEMITAPAIIRGNRSSLLSFDKFEKPLAIQIAGSNPDEMLKAVKIIEEWDFDEINLNVGCPSPKVSEYDMGLSLMRKPELVAELASAMKSATKKKISIKHRLGVVDNMKDIDTKKIYSDLRRFISVVSNAGVKKFTIHARIGVLNLDTKKNRSVPEIDYNEVYRIKEEFPNLEIEINGGIKSVNDIKTHVDKVDGVMLGRIAYENPMFLARLDSLIEYGEFDEGNFDESLARRKVITGMIEYIKTQESLGFDCYNILKHLHSIYSGESGSKKWKQLISAPWDKKKTASQILENSFNFLEKIKK